MKFLSTFFLLIILLIPPSKVLAQEKINIDSLAIQFLRTVPNTPRPFLTSSSSGKKRLTSQNYFWVAYKPIVQDSLKIVTYKFASAASHMATYFLITVTGLNGEQHKILSEARIEDNISKLLLFIEPIHLSNLKKTIIINQLTNALQ